MKKPLKTVGLAICSLFPACLPADTLPDNGISPAVDAQPEIERLQLTITNAEIRNQESKSKNEKLNARIKELESRIAEMKKSLPAEGQSDKK